MTAVRNAGEIRAVFCMLQPTFSLPSFSSSSFFMPSSFATREPPRPSSISSWKGVAWPHAFVYRIRALVLHIGFPVGVARLRVRTSVCACVGCVSVCVVCRHARTLFPPLLLSFACSLLHCCASFSRADRKRVTQPRQRPACHESSTPTKCKKKNNAPGCPLSPVVLRCCRA